MGRYTNQRTGGTLGGSRLFLRDCDRERTGSAIAKEEKRHRRDGKQKPWRVSNLLSFTEPLLCSIRSNDRYASACRLSGHNRQCVLKVVLNGCLSLKGENILPTTPLSNVKTL